MFRHAAAVAVVACLSSVPLLAQGKVITVSAESADVYKSPSTGAPIIGHASRGTALPITRELGSWVRVSWPDAADGVGYMHVSMGTIGTGAPSAPVAATQPPPAATARSAAQPASPAGSPAASPAPPSTHGVPAATAARPQLVQPVYVTPSSHMVGVGGLAGGPTPGFGASARMWRKDRIGAQVTIARYSYNNLDTPGSVTAVQFEPSVLYSLKDRVSDSLWVRPYVGGGVSIRHQAYNTLPPLVGPDPENHFGPQVFGGAELTFPGAPRLGVSGDVGYHGPSTQFVGANIGGLGISVSAHWYLR